MIIEADISNVLTYIKDLKAGDTFIYCDDIYILSDQFDDRDDSQLAVMLSNGVGKHLTPKAQVKPVHTKAVLV